MEATRTALTRKVVNQKQCHIPGQTADISAAIKDLKDAGVVSPYHIPIQFTYLFRRQIDLGE